MKRWPVLYPFLFAITPIVFLFAHNIAEVPARDLLLPVLAVITIALIVFFASRLVTGSYAKGGLITLWFLVLFFCYGYVRAPLRSLREGALFDFSRPGFLGSVWVLLFAAVAYLVIKSRRNFVTLTKFFNVVAGILVLISLVNIAIYEIGAFKPSNIIEGDDKVVLQKPDQPRDIYNYDNSEFINYLKAKGFYIADKSRSNYTGTILSLPSSLNMGYLNFAGDVYKEEYTATLYRILANNQVSQLLKSVGYRYIHIFSDWEIKDIGNYAQVYPYTQINKINARISSLENYFIQSTALEPFVGPFVIAGSRNSVLRAFDALADMPSVKVPKLVFVHISAPHPPWIFDREGNTPPPTDPGPERNIFEDIYASPVPWYNKERYIAQLIFINKKVEATIDEILAKSDIPPIIIIQGDHGPESYPYEDGMSLDKAIQRQRNERVGILNAYYFPDTDIDSSQLYDTITPVNSFRVIFNQYFGAGCDLLPDESYFLTFTEPRKFVIMPSESGAE